jgi:hypothetical protein
MGAGRRRHGIAVRAMVTALGLAFPLRRLFDWIALRTGGDEFLEAHAAAATAR